MKEIEIGDYVKTISGNIDKVDALYGMIENTIHLENHKWQSIKNIVKHSKNIIDLIEVGDIVEALDNWSGNKQIIYIYDDSDICELKLDIKNGFLKLLSITTDKQFNSIAYRLEE